ncbi:MAG: MmcQ/YjbR family DNA-binding protein [Saprospiraceae bacterium]|nr:MmcQ/YjbR family DNA-binding protein [Saprospiraceae bacterium]MCB9345403.1 MmcQ/YjbR family DNA-binding protein [Lewinellaceae bacterium]
MNLQMLRKLCMSLPETSEELRFGSDLGFSVKGELYCTTADDDEGGVSFKVKESEFREMTQREGIFPAPYLSRFHWVYVIDYAWLKDKEWEFFVKQSYELVKAEGTNDI